jgi:hypothetical protein
VGVPRAMAPRRSVVYDTLSPAQVAAGHNSKQYTEIQLCTEAVAWCVDNDKGAKAYLKEFPNKELTVSKLHRYLKGETPIVGRHADKCILTLDEERALAKFAAASADNHCGKTRAELRLHVVRLLQAVRMINLDETPQLQIRLPR